MRCGFYLHIKQARAGRLRTAAGRAKIFVSLLPPWKFLFDVLLLYLEKVGGAWPLRSWLKLSSLQAQILAREVAKHGSDEGMRLFVLDR